MSSARKNKTRKHKTPLLFALSFRVVLIVAAAAMILSYLSIYISPSISSIPLFFGLYFIPIIFLNLLLFIIALFYKSKSAWIPILVLLPTLLYAEAFFKIGSKTPPQKEGIKLKVESYNVGMFSSSAHGKSKNQCRETIIGHIRTNKPDIACFQEFYVNTKEQIDTLMGEYKYRYYHLFRIKNGDYFGNLIISKYPIVSSGKISFPQSTNLSIYADIQHFGKTIRIYNNHLESYNISFTGLVKKLSRQDQAIRDKISKELIEVHEKMRGTTIKRSDQVNKILKNISESHYPAIICGDFNDTPMSYTYHRLSKGRKDSFKESGQWFAGTYIPLWPLLRIDYILFPDQYEGIEHTTHKLKLSDHYPISAEIII